MAKSFDVNQIREVAEDLLPTLAGSVQTADNGLRGSGRLWTEPFAGLALYQPAGIGWAELCLGFSKILKESAARLADTSTALAFAADVYEAAETSGKQTIDDVFDVLGEQ